jgi:hypothetical protein
LRKKGRWRRFAHTEELPEHGAQYIIAGDRFSIDTDGLDVAPAKAELKHHYTMTRMAGDE